MRKEHHNDFNKPIFYFIPECTGYFNAIVCYTYGYFNIGANSGKIAGQSIMHCHIHLIPRRENDVDNPQGGVRGVIPSKQHYQRKK